MKKDHLLVELQSIEILDKRQSDNIYTKNLRILEL